MNERYLTPSIRVRWERAKEAERQATEARRAIEEELLAAIGATAETLEGTARHDGMRIVAKETVSVDVDEVQRLAHENGLTDTLVTLFRWKGELQKREWDRAPEAVRHALAPALTRKPARPAFEPDNSKGK